MNRRLSGMNQRDVENLANDPSAVVMQPTYDHIFEPWQSSRLLIAVKKIQEFAQASNSKEDVDKFVNDDAELKEFAKLHAVMYSKISDPVLANNSKLMEVVMFMIQTQESVRSGEIKDSDARARISDKALSSLQASVQPSDASN